MRFSCKYLLSSLIILAIPTTAIAQTQPSVEPSSPETLAEAFSRAFFTNAPDLYRDRSLLRQLNTFFGIASLTRNSFPENEYARDARLINILYQDALRQQAGSTVLRTPDLPNPYDSSLFSQPPAQVTPQEENTSDQENIDQQEINIPPDDAAPFDQENIDQQEINIPPDDAAPTEDIPIEDNFEEETTPEVVPFE